MRRLLQVLVMSSVVLSNSCWMDGRHDVEYREDIIRVENQTKMQLLTKARLEERFNIELSHYETNVYWTDTLCEGSPAVVYKRECYHGLMFDCDEIYVALRDRISDTAFAHELGHCYYLEVDGTYNGSHDDSEWWDYIGVINKEARERGW